MKGTHGSSGLTVLDSEVVGSDERSKTGRVDVLLDLECTKRSSSLR